MLRPRVHDRRYIYGETEQDSKINSRTAESLHGFLVVVCSLVCFRCAGNRSLRMSIHGFGRAAKSKIVSMERILIMRSQVVTDLMRGRKKVPSRC